MPRFFTTAMAGLVLLTAGSAAALARPELAEKAKAVLQTHCYQCHGGSGRAEAGLFVLNYQRLIDTKKVVPNDLKASKLFRRMAVTEDMPPETTDEGKPIPRPSAAELAAIKAWIEAGAPDFTQTAPPRRTFISDLDILKAILADLNQANERARQYLRYFTITHLYNSGLADDELRSYRLGLSKLINSLSWGRDIHVPKAIDPAGTVFRIDLRDLEWDESVWDTILAVNPYGVTYGDAIAKSCYALTRTTVPHVRADWFVFAASKPPLYHEILRLPTTVAALENRLEVDADRNIRQERVWRAAFNGSGVSRNNRLLERHRSAYGSYWKSYDFGGNVGRQNIFQHPLGPGAEPHHFQADGGEMIFSLPNGLQAYFLADARGRRLDRGPTSIVSDPKQADRAVVNGISCMSCHAQGMIAKDDQVRAHVESNPKAFSKAERDLILVLYPKKEVFDAKLKEDAERFQKAVKETGAHLSKTEPVYVLAKQFENEVDLRLAAAEAGVTVADFERGLDRSPTLARVFGPLKVRGGTIQRDVLAASFADLVRELQPGGKVVVLARVAPEPPIPIRPKDPVTLPPAVKFQPIERAVPVIVTPRLPDGESEMVRLPGAVTDAAVGGGGRYLLFRIARALAVFDVEAGKIVRQIPLAHDDVRFAAGATRLIVLYPSSQSLQIWNLETFEKERTAPFPGAMTQDEIRHVSMGSASNGPLFVYHPNHKRTLALNPPTLETAEVKWKHWGPKGAYGPLHMRATPAGDLLVGRVGGWAGAEMAFFRDGIQFGSDDKIPFSMGLFALPSADGRRIFIPESILNRDGGRDRVDELSNAYLVPASEAGFFIALHSKGRFPSASLGREETVNFPAVSQIAVYTDDRQRLFTVSGIDLKAGAGMPWERRVHYYPRAGLLAVLIAPDQLLLRKVDLIKSLAQTGADYLVVVSQPPPAKAGASWTYQLNAKARAGAVKIKLEAGPDGLAVTPEGKMTWLTPIDFTATAAAVTVTLQDAKGQEQLHQFSINVIPMK